jgi:membrane protein DedA with SNARE-associated domain
MPIALDFFIKYGYWVIFAWVLTEQLGVPIPSTPLLLTAGTLTATHQLRLPFVLAVALSASLIADTTWYVFGKRYGSAMVRLMCRLSFESTACVRKTETGSAAGGEVRAGARLGGCSHRRTNRHALRQVPAL